MPLKSHCFILALLSIPFYSSSFSISSKSLSSTSISSRYSDQGKKKCPNDKSGALDAIKNECFTLNESFFKESDGNKKKTFYQKSSGSVSSRRNAIRSITSSICSVAGAAFLSDITTYPDRNNAFAADDSSKDTIYLTGKAPKVPGQKPKNKDDTSGTKKDPGFLRSVSQCKGTCDRTPTADGLARTREECLSECQDICCTTYEQCTFAIVPRL